MLVAHTLRAEGFDASEDGTGRGIPLVVSASEGIAGTVSSKWAKGTGRPAGDECQNIVAIPFDTTQITHPENRSRPMPGDPAPRLAKGGHAPEVAFDARQSDAVVYGDKAGPLDTDAFSQGVHTGATVRRLTPTECERLQGFPDGWTAIPFRGKPASDGPRYKALGNSMAVNVMRWLGRRIDLVEREMAALAAREAAE
jgi:DNA (cytosine-5)-methyltransferase 1